MEDQNLNQISNNNTGILFILLHILLPFNYIVHFDVKTDDLHLSIDMIPLHRKTKSDVARVTFQSVCCDSLFIAIEAIYIHSIDTHILFEDEACNNNTTASQTHIKKYILISRISATLNGFIYIQFIFYHRCFALYWVNTTNFLFCLDSTVGSFFFSSVM